MNMKMSKIDVALWDDGNFMSRDRTLVDSHGVSKRARKEVIITSGKTREYIRERISLFIAKIAYGFNMATIWKCLCCE